MRETLAIYARISTEDCDKAHHLVDQSYSIANQIQLIRSFVESHSELKNMSIVEYIDDGFTGTNFNRPGFQALMQDVKSGKISCLVVKDFSRLGRSYLETGDYIDRIFPAANLWFISVNDQYDSKEYFGVTGGMTVAFHNLIYDTYSKDLSVKVKTAMHTRMENGKYVNHPPYGYTKNPGEKHKMVPDPITAPIVQRIFREVANGTGTSAIAKQLNDEHIPTPLQYKRFQLKSVCQNKVLLWTHHTILGIIRCYKYTGAMVNNTRESRFLRDPNQRRTDPSEWIVTEGAHEAIVSKELYEKANVMIAARTFRGRKDADGSDKVFYCGHCGRKLRITRGNDIYFSCDSFVYQTDAVCRQVHWSKSKLEETLLPIYKLQLTLLDEQIKRRKQAANQKAHSFVENMAQMEREVESFDRKKLDLFEQYHEGHISRDDFIAEKQLLLERQVQLQGKKAQLEEEYKMEKERRMATDYTCESAEAFLYARSLSDETLLKAMYEAIDRVDVYENNTLHIRWKFDDLFSSQKIAAS